MGMFTEIIAEVWVNSITKLWFSCKLHAKMRTNSFHSHRTDRPNVEHDELRQTMLHAAKCDAISIELIIIKFALIAGY